MARFWVYQAFIREKAQKFKYQGYFCNNLVKKCHKMKFIKAWKILH